MIDKEYHLLDWEEIDETTFERGNIRLVECGTNIFKVYIRNESGKFMSIGKEISKVWDLNLLMLSIGIDYIEDEEVVSIQDDVLREIRSSYAYSDMLLVFNTISNNYFLIYENEIFDDVNHIEDEKTRNKVMNRELVLLDFNQYEYPSVYNPNTCVWSQPDILDNMFDRHETLDEILKLI